MARNKNLDRINNFRFSIRFVLFARHLEFKTVGKMRAYLRDNTVEGRVPYKTGSISVVKMVKDLEAYLGEPLDPSLITEQEQANAEVSEHLEL